MIEQALKQMIRQAVLEELSSAASLSEPDLISLEEARLACGGLDKQTMINLVRNASATGFPAVVLGPRTIKVDRARLIPWLHSGGLAARQGKADNVAEIEEWRKAS